MPKLRLFLSSLVALAAAGFAYADGPSFSKDVQPLLDNYCYTCHSGNRPRSGVRVESYTDLLKGKRKLVTPEDPDGSRLVKMMVGKGAKKMPPRSSDRQPTEKEIALIKDWIKAGAKDDSDDKGSGSTKGSGSGSASSGGGSGSSSAGSGSSSSSGTTPRGEREREKGRREKEDDR